MTEWEPIGRGGSGRDGAEPRIDLAHGMDTDLDGRPDTVVVPDPLDLVVAADSDRDGIADLLIRFGADGRGDVVDLGADPGVLSSPTWDMDAAWGWCTDPG